MPHLCHRCNQKIVKDGYSYCYTCYDLTKYNVTITRSRTISHYVSNKPKSKPINYFLSRRGVGVNIPIDKNNKDNESDCGPNIVIDAIEYDKTVNPVNV